MTTLPFASYQEGRLIAEEKAGSRTAPDDITAGASVAADRAGQASQRYEVRPVAWVESPLKRLAQAPNQGREGAPPAWLVFEPEVAEAVRHLRAGEQVIMLTWLDRSRRDELSTVPGDNPPARRGACSALAHPTGPTRSACTGPRSSPSRACGSWSASSKRSTTPRSSTSNQCSTRWPNGRRPRAAGFRAQ